MILIGSGRFYGVSLAFIALPLTNQNTPQHQLWETDWTLFSAANEVTSLLIRKPDLHSLVRCLGSAKVCSPRAHANGRDVVDWSLATLQLLHSLHDTSADSRLRIAEFLGIYFWGSATWMNSGILYRTSCPLTPSKCRISCPRTPSKRGIPAPNPWAIFGKSHLIWFLRFNAKLNLGRRPAKMKPIGWKGWLHPGHSTLDLPISSWTSWVPYPTLHHGCPDVPPSWSELEGQSGEVQMPK